MRAHVCVRETLCTQLTQAQGSPYVHAHTCAHAQGNSGTGTLVQLGEQLPHPTGVTDAPLSSVTIRVSWCMRRKHPISGAFESIGS